MSVNDQTATAQDNTAPAADGQQKGADAALDTLISAVTEKQTAEPATDVKGNAPTGENSGLPFDKLDGKEGEDGAEKKDGITQENEAYTLTFPEGVVADPEAVKVLNEIGMKHNLPADAAQQLATTATEYLQRHLDANNKKIEQDFIGYRRMCQEKALKDWGSDAPKFREEATRGFALMQRNGVIPAADVNDPNQKALFQIIMDQGWFANMCRDYLSNNTEKPSIMGERDVQREHSGDVNWNI